MTAIGGAVAVLYFDYLGMIVLYLMGKLDQR